MESKFVYLLVYERLLKILILKIIEKFYNFLHRDLLNYPQKTLIVFIYYCAIFIKSIKLYIEFRNHPKKLRV